ncbi:MAG: ribosome maturation factor RimM [Gammaproteobacteria bacterium]|nr:ribosome maturation factor RimM [Gammaproteobacteria bacterium]
MTDAADQESEMITMGRVSGLFGVNGWVKLFSHTEPRENILQYKPLYIELQGEWQPLDLIDGRPHGKGVVAKFKGYTDRDAASALVGANIAIRQEQLPELPKGEYYWSELEGLKVVTTDGIELGVVSNLIETGANDVLVVKGDKERLIPYIRPDVVTELDRENGILRVEWDPEF